MSCQEIEKIGFDFCDWFKELCRRVCLQVFWVCEGHKPPSSSWWICSPDCLSSKYEASPDAIKLRQQNSCLHCKCTIKILFEDWRMRTNRLCWPAVVKQCQTQVSLTMTNSPKRTHPWTTHPWRPAAPWGHHHLLTSSTKGSKGI